MLLRRLRERAPSAIVITAAALPGYRLTFHKRGRDGSGKANARATGRSTDRVQGVVVEIAQREMAGLDSIEQGYERTWVRVETGADVGEVCCYEAREEFIEPGLLPFGWYHKLVVAGAREHRLPASYVRRLLSQPTEADPERERRARWERLLRGNAPA
jgi:hypothetical protein